MSEYRVIDGGCLSVLRDLDAGSVQTCITSPPYYGLRDYGHDGQIGLEQTPEQYVANLVAVFREVRRVLRDDGTFWLNLGDSYAGSWGAQSRPPGDASTLTRNGGTGPNPKMLSASQIAAHPKQTRTGSIPADAPYKPKDLLGIPWMVAFALRADGWYLRSDIIWAKPNPMPESVMDRPTKAHEYLFLLSKSSRYYYDAEAIREDGVSFGRQQSLRTDKIERAAEGIDRTWHGPPEDRYDIPGRNKRSVWTVATQPFPGAHFATFPPKLIEPCVLAGSSPQACAECGAPWERVVEKPDFSQQPRRETAKMERTDRTSAGQAWQDWRDVNPDRLIGWQPTCDHDAGTGRCTVLDPFNGAGTTGVVALRNDRNYIGIELNPEYAQMARDRIYDDGPLLNVEKAA